MAHQVLARKYRPKNFGELVGQDHATRALINGIDSGRLHHAYLLTGTRGVGKTTIARILAKCLNCTTGITSTPCGVCDACVGVDDGSFLDLIEIDAASRTKVEDTRELLENVPYAPVMGRIKVYLIDEVHMLSASSFNALLKTLEEPPAHAKFILATTDPQKLPVTIVSRCLQFVLRPLSQETLARHLAGILTQENIAFEDNALWQLAQSAKGSVRDALSLTDQAIAFGGGQIDSDTVKQMLGLIDGTQVLELIEAIHTGDTHRLSEYIQELRQNLVDAPMVLEHLADALHQIALHQVLPQTDEKRIAVLAKSIAPEMVQLYYEIVTKSKDGLRLSISPMQTLEMTLLRMFAFRPLPHSSWVDGLSGATSLPHLPKDTKANNEVETATPSALSDEVQDTATQASIQANPSTQETSDEFVANDINIVQQSNQSVADSVQSNQSLKDHTSQQMSPSLFHDTKPKEIKEIGVWTAAAWDEWVYEAHQQGIIAADELALASHATIVGDVGGEASLVVDDVHYQTQKSFDRLKLTLKDTTGTNLSLLKGLVERGQTPKAFQNKRHQALLLKLEEEFLTSKVMSELKSGGFLAEDGVYLVGSLRLIT